jgi:predicted MFS family arabinose efflux permease
VSLQKKAGGSPDQPEILKTRDVLHAFSRTPSLLLTYAAFAGSMFLTAAYLSWLPTFFHRVDHLSMENAALKGSLVMLLSVVGFPLGGYLADQWRKKRANGRLLFPALSSLATAVVFFTAFYALQGPLQYPLILLGGVLASAFSPAAIAVTQDVVHPGLRATSYSFCVVTQNLLGSSLGPLFVGALSDRYDIQTALMVVPVFSLIASVLYLCASFFYARDLEKVEKVPLRIV